MTQYAENAVHLCICISTPFDLRTVERANVVVGLFPADHDGSLSPLLAPLRLSWRICGALFEQLPRQSGAIGAGLVSLFLVRSTCIG
jgi:hypothetical protein